MEISVEMKLRQPSVVSYARAVFSEDASILDGDLDVPSGYVGDMRGDDAYLHRGPVSD